MSNSLYTQDEKDIKRYLSKSNFRIFKSQNIKPQHPETKRSNLFSSSRVTPIRQQKGVVRISKYSNIKLQKILFDYI